MFIDTPKAAVVQLLVFQKAASCHLLSPMRDPKLSGREIAVLRAIGFAEPIPGPDLVETTQIAEEDVIDILNGLMDVGYVECTPIQPKATAETYSTTSFEVNPSYVQQIKDLIIRRF